ncbi:T3SS effector HopA1 family protein [Streptomyces sp. NPDC017435]|uniref:T3SS effector HopA1 family protein n=1 Tax=Streptomyces sp. NPDC017435 TaxID=3364995 RepID=UPI0037998407
MTVLDEGARTTVDDTTVDGLNRRLADAIALVDLAPDGLSARIEDREITADTPARLRDRLAVLIYEHLHAGRPEREESMPRSLRDWRLERLLHEATPHRSTPHRARLCGLHENLPVVEIDGIRVCVPEADADPGAATSRATHTAEPSPALSVAAGLRELAARPATADGDTYVDVYIPAARPALSPGFFLADGSLGRPVTGALLRLYTHVTEADHAPGVWHTVLTALEEARVPYRAKISSSPLLYPRRDALVVYLSTDALHAVDTVREAVRDIPGLGAQTSPFADEIAPGFAAAWEPEDNRPGHRAMSFGEHRSAAVAAGLTAHRLTPTHPSAAAAVAAALTEAGVDPAHPARSLGRPHADPRKGV